MNGEVNGTMGEPMETTLQNLPVGHIKASSNSPLINNCEKNNITENKNELDTELTQALSKSKSDQLTNHMSGDEVDHQLNESECDNTVSIQKPSNNDLLNSDCSNSNESCSETGASQHIDTDSARQSPSDDIQTNDVEKNSSKAGSITNYESDEIDSEEDSSDEESVVIRSPKADDAVSINSDSEVEGCDETSQENDIKNKDKNKHILENDNENGADSQNGNIFGTPSPEVHEIPSDNDDFTSTTKEKSVVASISGNKIQLRRSNRTAKRKKFMDEMENGGCESDVEEVEIEDPLSCKMEPIVINDTKTLVEIAAKQMKTSRVNQKKEPTVVILDTNSGKMSNSKTTITSSNSSINAQSLYDSIVARGTTVTPVSSKTNSSSFTQSPQPAQPSILPSLTDDMFVVEAPSFIVPYVYESPSVKAFREFVDLLGKELEERRAKEEQETLEKEKVEKEKRDKEKSDRKERGEVVEESEEEKDIVKTDKAVVDPKKKKRDEKRERRKRRNDDDDASWDGESSSDSEEEALSDCDTVVIKDKVDSMEGIKNVTSLTADKVCTGKSDNYFDNSLGKFFVNIGLSMVQEYVQNDLLKQQNRKLYREKKSGQNTRGTESSIASLMKNLEFSKENNAPYKFSQNKCDFCSFKSESSLVMSHHLETPHMKNNVYKCNYCSFEIRSPHDILYHMEAEHNVKGKLERAPAYHQCANCPFEDNGKGKLARHQIACAKKFKPDLNLAPPVEWEPPAKIPKIARSNNNVVNTYQNAFNRQVGTNMGRPPMGIGNLLSPASSYRPRGRSPLAVPPRSAPLHGAPILRGGVMVRHNAPTALVGSNYPIASNGKPKSLHQPSISITPLPRAPQPAPLPAPSKNTFVICEICDGYIRDLEQLRNHMQWIHKVKIHPKMIYNRPPLNCQKCQFRFFTDQGLERHLLGSHGLVTSSMQEAANKGKDAGRCPVCGRIYQWKLLNHVARDHNLTLKPAHLSYKCTVCTATFGMYKQFENHVYSAHSVVAKRVQEKSKAGPNIHKSGNDSLLKPLKINDEITIIPQPAKPAASKNK